MTKIHRIALLLPKGHEYAIRLIEGAIGYVAEGAKFQFVEVPYDEGRTPPVVYSLDVDGALVWTSHDCSWVLDLRDRSVKLVSLNSEWLDDGIPCVSVDKNAELDEAVAHLATLDRKRAAYVGHATSGNPSKMRSRDGFLTRAQARGWTAVSFDVPGIPSEERQRLSQPSAEQELIQFLQSLPLPVAIFCDDDYVAALVCRVAQHLGYAVPGDMAVLGYFDLTISRFSIPTLSSIPAPGHLVGAAGMKLLSELLAGKSPPQLQVTIDPPPVVQRESTGGTILRDDDIRHAHQLIQEFACKGLSVEQLLNRLVMSQKTLNKRFKAVYGHTPGTAIRRVRAEQAKQWLATTDMSIGRISDMCGFEDASNFNLFFKREVGCTPGEYRKKSR